MSFADKVVIVTGASSGIGAATGEAFAAAGGAVVLVARSRDKLSAVAERCRRVLPTPHAPPPLVIVADVADDQQARSVIQQTIDKYGKIDVLVNNAGIVRYGSLLEGDFLEAYDAVMLTNMRATIQLTRDATPYLIQSKGNIVNVSSISSTLIHNPKYTPYSMSKAAMDHFTRGAAMELAPCGVRVNSVNPGPVRTDILDAAGYEGTWDDMKAVTALGRVSESEEIADLILFLASDKAKGITGSMYVTDNGTLLKH